MSVTYVATLRVRDQTVFFLTALLYQRRRELGTRPDLLPTLAAVRGDLRTLTDLGYEGEADTVVVAFKKPKNGELTELQQTLDRAHNRLRAVGERGNSLLKVTFKALRNISLMDPWPIGAIAAAALVILHTNHARTT